MSYLNDLAPNYKQKKEYITLGSISSCQPPNHDVDVVDNTYGNKQKKYSKNKLQHLIKKGDGYILQRTNCIHIIHLKDIISLRYEPKFTYPDILYSCKEKWCLKTSYQNYNLTKKEYDEIKQLILDSYLGKML